MADKTEVEHFLGMQNRLGEGPRWNADEGLLYWVDIERNAFYRCDPAIRKPEKYDIGQPIGVLAFRVQGGLLLGLREGLAFWDFTSQSLEVVAQPEKGRRGARFNDGLADCRGRFWVGTTSFQEDPGSALYCLDPDHSLHTLVRGATISNGVDWSPDNKTMYYNDTPTHTTVAYDYAAETGIISNKRVFVSTPDEYPDGLTVDSEGFIWCAYFGSWKVVRYDPDGTVEREVKLPASNVTCCVFGGPNLTDLYITTAWSGLSDARRKEQPLAGDLFVLHTDVKGKLGYKYGG